MAHKPIWDQADWQLQFGSLVRNQERQRDIQVLTLVTLGESEQTFSSI